MFRFDESGKIQASPNGAPVLLSEDINSLANNLEQPMTLKDTDYYIRHILERQNTSFKQQVTTAFGASFTAFKLLNLGGGAMDVIGSTNTRTLQVYGNVVANGSNSDAQNALSPYQRWLTENGPGTAATGAAYGLLAFDLVTFMVGMGREWYHNYRLNRVESLDYDDDRLNELGYKAKGIVYQKTPENDARRIEMYRKFLDKKKVVDLAEQKKGYVKEKPLKDAYQPDEFTRVMQLFSGRFKLSERNLLFNLLGSDYDLPESDIERNWFEKFIVAGSLVIKNLWSMLSNFAFKYWLVWWPFVLIVGIAAASTSAVFAPIIVGLTIGLGLLYMAPKVFVWALNLSKDNEELTKDKSKTYHEEVELPRMSAEVKYRHFIKVDHKLNEQYLKVLGAFKPAKLKRLDEYWKKPLSILDKKKTDVQKSDLVKYLLAGSDARIAVSIVTDVVSAIILTSFACWFISAVAFAVAGAIPFFIFFDSMFNSGVAGLVIGAFFGYRKYFDMKTAQLDYEQRIHEKLCEDYKDTGVTKLEHFERVEHAVEFKRGQVEFIRLQILLDAVREDAAYEYARIGMTAQIQDKSTKSYTAHYQELHALRIRVEKQLQNNDRASDFLASEYDLDKIDVYNHEYREKQRHQAGWWTMIKRVFNHVYTFFAGAQTGSLLARSLFIAGCVFGGVIGGVTGTLPIFLGIAISLAVIYASVCLAQYMIENERTHKENFLKNMDGNISYLNKKNKELDMLVQYLENNRDGKPQHDFSVIENDIKLEQRSPHSSPYISLDESGSSPEISLEEVTKVDPTQPGQPKVPPSFNEIKISEVKVSSSSLFKKLPNMDHEKKFTATLSEEHKHQIAAGAA